MKDEDREAPRKGSEDLEEDEIFVLGDEGEDEEEGSKAVEIADGTAADESAAVSDEAFQAELQNLQQEITKFKELYLRKLADFDNYRKRQEREMVEFRRHANSELMHDCLPVLDNLERALAVSAGNQSGVREGVELVLRQFKETLGRYGLREVDPIDQPFDPAVHEAIQKNEAAGVEQPTVVQVLQKGYQLGERLVRPALVIVALPVGPDADASHQGVPEESHGENHRN